MQCDAATAAPSNPKNAAALGRGEGKQRAYTWTPLSAPVEETTFAPVGTTLGLVSAEQHEVEEVPTPGSGPREQQPVTE